MIFSIPYSSRGIAALLIMPVLVFAGEDGSRYSTNQNYDQLHGSISEACRSLSIESHPLNVINPSVTGNYRVVSSPDGTYTCEYSFSYHPYSQPHNPVKSSVSYYGVVYTRSKCVAGESETFSWPLGRESIALGGSSFVSFGGSLPETMCINACRATGPFSANPDTFYGVPESDNDGYEIIYANIDAVLDGSSCDASESDQPTIPPFDTGGGDTGGGDTGGDTGGGDLGGGTTTPGGGDGSVGGGTGGTGGDTGGGTGGTGGDTGGGTGGTGGDTGGGTGGTGGTGGDTGGSGAGNSAGGLACNQPLTCEGDAVQCAILRTQKAQLCADLEAADFEGHKGQIESLFSGPDYKREADEVVTVPSFVTGITRFFPTNTCPADTPISLSSFGGRTLKISYQPICSFASALGPLIVIAATVFSALYVGRSFGGE